jgi:hypothetical protein
MKTTFSLTHSGMGDLLLFIHGVMKICLVVGVMVLVATWPARSNAAKGAVGAGGQLFTSLLPPSAAKHYARAAHGQGRELDFDWLASTDTAIEPINLLGSDAPDANYQWSDPPIIGNEDRWESDSDTFEPAFNIDGTMMMGAFDTNGNMYGVTDDHSDSWDIGATTSMWDD